MGCKVKDVGSVNWHLDKETCEEAVFQAGKAAGQRARNWRKDIDNSKAYKGQELTSVGYGRNGVQLQPNFNHGRAWGIFGKTELM